LATTVFLVRHAAHDRVDRVLCGRMPGVGLGEAGQRQAEALARRFACEGVDAVWTSPLQRARETAEPVAARLGLAARPSDALCEIDFGAWTGQAFDALRDDPRWRRWNEARGSERPPGGESMTEAQTRAAAEVERARAEHPDGRVVLPDEFRAYAGIGEVAVFVGQGFKFQIWEPGRFAERQRETRSHLRSVTRGLGRGNPTAGPASPSGRGDAA